MQPSPWVFAVVDEILRPRCSGCNKASLLSDRRLALCNACCSELQLELLHLPMLGIAARFSCAKYLGPIPTLLSHAKNMPYSGSYFVLEKIFAMMAADLFEHQSSSQKLVFTVVPPSIQRVMSGWYLPASLAFSLAKRFRGRYSGLLKRSKNVPKQASLDAVQRRTNLVNCFIPQKKLLRTNLADAHIVIVDDVSTTGASLAESWRCLETMGAKQITAISLAHAPLRGGC